MSARLWDEDTSLMTGEGRQPIRWYVFRAKRKGGTHWTRSGGKGKGRLYRESSRERKSVKKRSHKGKNQGTEMEEKLGFSLSPMQEIALSKISLKSTQSRRRFSLPGRV